MKIPSCCCAVSPCSVENVYIQGCHQALSFLIEKYSDTVNGIAGFSIFLLLIGCILAEILSDSLTN
jgi:hypothetical protein